MIFINKYIHIDDFIQKRDNSICLKIAFIIYSGGKLPSASRFKISGGYSVKFVTLFY